ncbi:hypothetical protein EDB89DRAFT_2067191 [Lactarius sanguifluus]|nr:hypothetical protein EDB89DRAFT_2067191 [Lactarius sanguifluus]
MSRIIDDPTQMAYEVNEDRRAQLEKEAEEQRREAEKKKPRLNPFDPTRRVSDWIVPRPASYALDKIDNLEYVELDYFTDLRPSKNIRNDEDLSLEEMLEATFFVALERHPRRLRVNGKKVLLIYQSRVRREWFDALARDGGFNIGLIGDDLVRNIADEVNDRIWESEIDQVRTRGLDRSSR